MSRLFSQLRLVGAIAPTRHWGLARAIGLASDQTRVLQGTLPIHFREPFPFWDQRLGAQILIQIFNDPRQFGFGGEAHAIVANGDQQLCRKGARPNVGIAKDF